MAIAAHQDLMPCPCARAAFYKWLQQEYSANAVLHFGMHGTVEWLPGAPLGETPKHTLTFQQALSRLSQRAAVYIYISESNLA